MKKVIAFAAFATLAMTANAQVESNQASTASQNVKLVMSNAIELTFTGTGKDRGADVSLPFTTVTHYANGVESEAQELKVRSNKDFMVCVKTSDDKFSYSGTTSPAPEMRVKNVLGLRVSSNNTGGSIVSPFQSSAYRSIDEDGSELLTNCKRGGDQKFAVQYKATPGFSYPAGTYSVDVIFTATQM